VQEICAAGPEVRVLEPAHVREAVVAALTAVVAAHEGSRGAG
jgi:proteasome accessory factor B